MTQQGKRQARFREWAGTSLTYNGDMMSAGRAAGGITDGTVNEAEWWLHGAISGTDATTLSGRQAATAEYLGVPSGWDAVGDELPVSAWDFTSGGLFPDLTYGTPVAGAVSRDSLIYRSSGEARTSSLGLLVEVQTVNKCANFNMKMVDTTGTTPDAAWTTHEALDLGSIPDEVFNALPPFTQGKLTAVYHSISNGAGQIVIDGVTGNTNTHTPSEWHYVVSGDFGTGLSSLGASQDPTVGEWVRFEKPGTPTAGTDTQVVGSSQASEVYWFGNQLEENAGRTSLIEVQGSAVTRLGDPVSDNFPSSLTDNAFTCSVEFSQFIAGSGGENPRIVQIDDGSNGAGLRLTDNIIDSQAQQLNSGNAAINIDGPAYVQETIVRHAFGVDGSTMRYAISGTFIGEDSVDQLAPYTTTRFGFSPGNVRQTNGYIRSVALYDEAATQAVVVRLSA